jgi:hypothetical protein
MVRGNDGPDSDEARWRGPHSLAVHLFVSRDGRAYFREICVETVLVHTVWKVEDEQCTISAPVNLRHSHGKEPSQRELIIPTTLALKKDFRQGGVQGREGVGRIRYFHSCYKTRPRVNACMTMEVIQEVRKPPQTFVLQHALALAAACIPLQCRPSVRPNAPAPVNTELLQQPKCNGKEKQWTVRAIYEPFLHVRDMAGITAFAALGYIVC